MGKLKPNRQRVSSPTSMNRIAMIIRENWDETWEIVQQRARTEIYQKKLYSTRVQIFKHSNSK